MDIVHKNGTFQTYNVSVVATAISRLDIKQYPLVTARNDSYANGYFIKGKRNR